MSRANLSVVLITKNEAENLEACLKSVSWADEIVIVDAGSMDGTIEIAHRFTDKVYIDANWQGFGPQRQQAQKKASGDWIFFIDADERVTPELKKEIHAILERDDRQKIYAVPRLSWAFGSFIRHSGWYPDYVVRIYPRKRAGYNDAVVHEKVIFGEEMSVTYVHGDLLHYTFRDLEQWVNKTARYASVWGQDRFLKGKKGSVGAAIGHAIGFFCTAFLLRRGFLDGRAGLILALLGAYSRFLKYIDLWIRQQPGPQKN